ncbi:MAG TPA: hypothetical protein VMS78_04275 [Rhizomicrobium sp.]|nr:hypothetical protein [Rhizomicrobium sp.]
MSELSSTRTGIRLQLLGTASALGLLVAASGAKAGDSDHPTVWIELGGAFDQISREATQWVPPNLTDPISNPSPEPFGKPPAIGYDYDAALQIQPHGSDWMFGASLRYGRAQRGPKHFHDQTYKTEDRGYGKYALTTYAFLNAKEQSRSAHTILDFNVGRDVGLGAFHDGKSTIHFGVRMAQLTERAEASMTAFSTAPAKYSTGKIVHKADALMARSYTGFGPAVSWDGATPLAGSLNDGFSFDWGVNASVLFGRQKAHIALHTQDARYYGSGANSVLSHLTSAPSRDRTVVVPNLGGFAGLSWRLPNGKISLGYRADFFFGAIDGGLSTSEKDTRGFSGPFGSLSIGLGG